MRAKIAALCLTLSTGAAVCSAQTAPENTTISGPAGQPGYSKVYCSGFVKDTKVPDEARIVSGEQIGYKIFFGRGDMVYLNQGINKGVRGGDRFLIVRTMHYMVGEWFKGQRMINTH